ncbi:MAG TPA: RnfH family protein [Paracoccaceae bacterium]|uniref:RnfH family protein n=1 Tax=Hydrogenophaga sp. TaxID=1904254 RepID=UPI002B6885EE|nr:RnfH family protein [Hydrogenophaga sp.]HMO06108.1 RnfH family protein [Paracoccaceae bacterium]HMP10635.1 RnfH family protein [Hydrogenophaga sp.]
MKVILVYAPAARCCHEEHVCLPDGLDAGAALQTAGWVERFPELKDGQLSMSVWGRQVDRQHLLRDGDRLEICRPLRVDPKVARRERFVAQGARGSGLFASRRPGSKAGY